jgi:hypothetical protein
MRYSVHNLVPTALAFQVKTSLTETPPQDLRKFSRPFKGHAKNANIAAHQLSDELSFSGARAT